MPEPTKSTTEELIAEWGISWQDEINKSLLARIVAMERNHAGLAAAYQISLRRERELTDHLAAMEKAARQRARKAAKPVETSDADKIALAKVWAKAHRKKPLKSVEGFIWGAGPCALDSWKLFCALKGEPVPNSHYKAYATEEGSWLALYAALETCGELPVREVHIDAGAKCPHCGEPKVNEDETVFFYQCGSTFSCVDQALSTNEKCRELAKAKPATGTLRELVNRWKELNTANHQGDHYTNGFRAAHGKCAAELAAALDALEPSEEEITAAYCEMAGVCPKSEFIEIVRWMLARIATVAKSSS